MITVEHMKHDGSGRGPKGRGGPGGRGRRGGPGGRRRGRQSEPPTTTTEALRAWFAGQLPDDWFTAPVEVHFDRDEIIVTGTLAKPKVAKGDDKTVAAESRVSGFREDTREQRIAIADRAELHFERKVSWAVECGDVARSFTRASAPVMSRLHFEERHVLDTLIDAGVARSRSEAVAWCVHLVAQNETDWLDRLREAMTDLESVRDQGPFSA